MSALNTVSARSWQQQHSSNRGICKQRQGAATYRGAQPSPPPHLARCVPDLCLDGLAIHLQHSVNSTAMVCHPQSCRKAASQPPRPNTAQLLAAAPYGGRRRRCHTPAACRPPPLPHLYAAGGKLNADGRLALQRELVAGEPAKQVGLADPAVADQHDLEQVVIAAGGAAGQGCVRGRRDTPADHAGPAGRQQLLSRLQLQTARRGSLVIRLGHHGGLWGCKTAEARGRVNCCCWLYQETATISCG
jgi:hypothetical protein